MFSFIFMCLAVAGIYRMAVYAKNNPGQVMDAMSILKRMFGK